MRALIPNVDLRPDHLAIVRRALRQHVPACEVLVFGSRATWTAKDYSDLDLAIVGDHPLSLKAASALAEALGESDLPFKVDVVDWAKIDDGFRRIIRRHGVVVQAMAGISHAVGPVRQSLPVIRKSIAAHGMDKSQVTQGGACYPVLPGRWQLRSLYSMATWVSGITSDKIRFSETGRPIIRISELEDGISGQTRFTQQTFDDSVVVRSGDLLFSCSSGQPETSIDAYWWRGPKGWLDQHVFKVMPEVGLNPVFFYYLLRYLKPSFVGIARNKQTTGFGPRHKA